MDKMMKTARDNEIYAILVDLIFDYDGTKTDLYSTVKRLNIIYAKRVLYGCMSMNGSVCDACNKIVSDLCEKTNE